MSKSLLGKNRLNLSISTKTSFKSTIKDSVVPKINFRKIHDNVGLFNFIGNEP